MLLPDRKFRGVWHRILHDRTAEEIQEQVSRLPHANVTSVPFQFDTIDDARVPLSAIVGGPSRPQTCPGLGPPGAVRRSSPRRPADRTDGHAVSPVDGCEAIANVRYRDRVRVGGPRPFGAGGAP